MAVGEPFPLLDLPNELIMQVAEQVDEARDLKCLARTCRRITYLVDPVMYRHVLVASNEQSLRLYESLNNDKTARKRNALQSLKMPCQQELVWDFESFRRTLAMCANLRVLELQSPQCCASISECFEGEVEWQRMAHACFQTFEEASLRNPGPHRPLQHLSKVVIHMNGPSSPYWTPTGRSASIFLHPTLNELTLSCINIPPDLDVGNPDQDGQHKTALRVLVLEECNISHEGLAKLLSLPEALDTLYLGENVSNVRYFPQAVDRIYNHLFCENTNAAIEALRQQKHSLRDLTYVTLIESEIHDPRHRRMARATSVSGAFNDFSRLHHITLHGLDTSFERAVLHNAHPPSLQTLTCHTGQGPREWMVDINEALTRPSGPKGRSWPLPFLRVPAPSLPRTPRVEVTVSFYLNPYNEREISPAQKDVLARCSRVCGREVLNVAVSFAVRDTGNFFPPYLFREPKPTLTVFHEANEKDFVGDEIAVEEEKFN